MSLFKKKTENRERKIPVHIGIIMDGNGRWAKKRLLPRSAGHAAGSETFKKIAKYCNKIGVKYLTVYAFSTENWKRPKAEVDAIMDLLRKYLKDQESMKAENIKLKFIGDRTPLPEDIKDLMELTERELDGATGLTVYMAVNYGGRDEIVHACKNMVKKVQEGELSVENITEEALSKEMFAEYPDPDIIIRPSGEYRLSNFLVWQSAYAEFWYSDVLWPDFTEKHLDKAIDDFNGRDRRFGASEEVKK